MPPLVTLESRQIAPLLTPALPSCICCIDRKECSCPSLINANVLTYVSVPWRFPKLNETCWERKFLEEESSILEEATESHRDESQVPLRRTNKGWRAPDSTRSKFPHHSTLLTSLLLQFACLWPDKTDKLNTWSNDINVFMYKYLGKSNLEKLCSWLWVSVLAKSVTRTVFFQGADTAYVEGPFLIREQQFGLLPVSPFQRISNMQQDDQVL